MSDSADLSHSPESSSAQPPILGPVAAKGPKRFAAMPDLSKIPESARRRMAQFADIAPEWGVSSTDARSLRTVDDPDAVALDLGPLGSPTSESNRGASDVSRPVPPVLSADYSVEDNGFGVASVSLDDDELADDSELPDFPEGESGDEFGSELAEQDDSTPLSLGGNLDILPATSDEVPASALVSQPEERSGAPDHSPDRSLSSPDGLSFQQVPSDHSSGTRVEQDLCFSDEVPIFDEPSFYDEPGYPDFSPLSDFEATSLAPRTSREGSDSYETLERLPTGGSQSAQNLSHPGVQSSSRSDIEDVFSRERAEEHLRQLVGRGDARLRDDQWRAIKALVVDRRRTLVVQRTGWGKSAVYFVATALLRATGAGPTIIISPLLALMRDQIRAAEQAGIRAVTINSANVTEWEATHELIRRGEIDVLLCSPERLNNPAFRDTVLPQLAHNAGLVVVDEAHCISDWGHDFRPDYRRIRTLLEDLKPGIPVLATTATANERVSRDVAEQLAQGSHSTSDVLVLRGGLDRESLHLAVVSLPHMSQRLAWITDALHNLAGSGIVYCLTVSAAMEVTEHLRSAGLDVASYTGRTDPDERAVLEDRLKNNDIKALIATSALGMGFDKPDLRFVIHLGAPNSPISYYQQVGRAGRGVSDATAVLLPGKEDTEIWEYFGSLAFPPEKQVRSVLAILDEALTAGHPVVTVPQLESRVDLKRSRLELLLKVLDVDGAVHRVQGGWTATGQQWVYDADRYSRVEQARLSEQKSMLEYARLSTCRIAFLRSVLDDPELTEGARCGRCDNCGGVTLPTQVSADALEQTKRLLETPGIAIPQRKMWPSNMSALGVALSGKIEANSLVEEGRAVARIDGLGWSGELREAFSKNTPDGPTPVRLRNAAAQVMSAWDAHTVVEGVVSVRSTTRPELVGHLARGLASYLKIPYVGEVGPRNSRPADRHDVNSAIRLASVAQRLSLELSEGAKRGLPGRAILLVDDFTDSGWTLTIAGKLLRDAGAAKVYPFTLAQY